MDPQFSSKSFNLATIMYIFFNTVSTSEHLYKEISQLKSAEREDNELCDSLFHVSGGVVVMLRY